MMNHQPLPAQALIELAQGAREDYLELLQALVKHESPSHDKAAADKLADYLEARLHADGWQVERIAKAEVGDQLVARWQVDSHKPSTLIMTHYDTVWAVGSLEQMPLKTVETAGVTCLYGPGILDMKGGITSAIIAVQQMKKAAIKPKHNISLLLSSDEEISSHHSQELIEKLAQEHQRVLVLEPAREDGAFKIGRKGTAFCKAYFTGISSHAGNNPEAGASALRELAHFLFFAENLTDKLQGTTLNLTVASGGGVSNVIAEQASAEIDIRVLKIDEYARVETALLNYEAQDSRVKVRIEVELNRPPLEPSPANQAIFHDIEAFYTELGQSCQAAVVGGGSDGNFSAALGIATMDGLGAVGEGLHARHEHIRIEESLERMALLIALLQAKPS